VWHTRQRTILAFGCGLNEEMCVKSAHADRLQCKSDSGSVACQISTITFTTPSS
jgi:hypothetical protein